MRMAGMVTQVVSGMTRVMTRMVTRHPSLYPLVRLTHPLLPTLSRFLLASFITPFLRLLLQRLMMTPEMTRPMVSFPCMHHINRIPNNQVIYNYRVHRLLCHAIHLHLLCAYHPRTQAQYYQ